MEKENERLRKKIKKLRSQSNNARELQEHRRGLRRELFPYLNIGVGNVMNEIAGQDQQQSTKWVKAFDKRLVWDAAIVRRREANSKPVRQNIIESKGKMLIDPNIKIWLK